MRLLIDTHIFLWAVSGSSRLKHAAEDAITDPSNDVLVSAITAWEISIKWALGKLRLPNLPATYVPGRIRSAGYQELKFTVEHAVAVSSLPNLHADPFDRALIAQALVEGLTLVSADPAMLQYAVQSINAGN